MNFSNYSHIIWDWNGTLCNDTEWCINVINRMLLKRGLKTFKNINEYRNIFCFPVIDYYKKIGFDFEKEPFEELAAEFISLYHSYENNSFKLHNHAEAVLREIHMKGITQIILSASETDNLLHQMSGFDIRQYFDEILGISDIYAVSKTEMGLDYVKRNQLKCGLLIGDTEHDFETAEKLKLDCILIANGHQSREKLITCGVPVFNEISEVLILITH
ncbi:MAG: HAD hydrolase-like protein [Oscillospiraceae bacterium]|nr:HAD hydrolase-like protein [Oscillospiraceae bacterium]